MSNNTGLETRASTTYNPSNDEKNIATITHLAGTLFSIIPALIVWVLKKRIANILLCRLKRRLTFKLPC